MSCDPAIPLLSIYTREVNIYVHKIFFICLVQNSSKLVSTPIFINRRINKQILFHTIEHPKKFLKNEILICVILTMGKSQKYLLNEGSQAQRIDKLLILLYEVQRQAKLMCCDKNQNSGYLWFLEREHKKIF